MHRLIFRASAHQNRIVALRHAFNKDGDDLPRFSLIGFQSPLLNQIDQTLKALLDNLTWGIILHACCRGAFAL